jgi:hypothetical protein
MNDTSESRLSVLRASLATGAAVAAASSLLGAVILASWPESVVALAVAGILAGLSVAAFGKRQLAGVTAPTNVQLQASPPSLIRSQSELDGTPNPSFKRTPDGAA